MTYLFPQDLVLREPLLRLALIEYVTVIATRSTKPPKESLTSSGKGKKPSPRTGEHKKLDGKSPLEKSRGLFCTFFLTAILPNAIK
jgi:hypothetical protein